MSPMSVSTCWFVCVWWFTVTVPQVEDKRAEMEKQLISMKVQYQSLQQQHAFSKQQMHRMKVGRSSVSLSYQLRSPMNSPHCENELWWGDWSPNPLSFCPLLPFCGHWGHFSPFFFSPFLHCRCRLPPWCSFRGQEPTQNSWSACSPCCRRRIVRLKPSWPKWGSWKLIRWDWFLALLFPVDLLTDLIDWMIIEWIIH